MAATMIIDSEADPRRRDRGYHTTEAHYALPNESAAFIYFA